MLTNQKVKQGATTQLDLSYEYNNASNQKTGQLLKLTDNLNNSRSRGFVYDKLARLTQATGGSDPLNNPAWTQTYSYDRYGNRTSVVKTGSVALDAVNPGGNASSQTLSYVNAQSQTLSNRITTAGYEYDEAGNLTRGQDTDGTWQRYRYDAAGRVAQILNDSSAMLEYQRYGASNQRLLMQHWNGSETYYGWEGGSVAAEYSGANGLTWQKSYVYPGGRLFLTEKTANQYQLPHPD